MRRNVPVWMLTILISLPSFFGFVQRAEATHADQFHHEWVDRAIGTAQAHLDEYAASGDLQTPLVQQLGNALNQVRHHLEKGSTVQASKKMKDFQKHLHSEAMQAFLSGNAKETLDAYVKLIVEALEPPSSQPVTLVVYGQPNAVIIVPEDATTGNHAPNWSTWSNFAGTAELAQGTAHTGFSSMRLNDMKRGGIAQVIDLKPGTVTANVYYYSPSSQVSSGKISIGMNLRDANNQQLSTIRSEFVPFADASGVWRQLVLHRDIPATINNKTVVRAQLFVDVDGGEGAQVWIDDIVVSQQESNGPLVKNGGFEQSANPYAKPLIEYIQKATGVELPVVTSEPAGFNGVKMYVGKSRDVDEARHQILLQQLNEHGFVIDPQEDAITIIGTTKRATEFGVYSFLERYVGVRWLMPGPDGEDVPQLGSLAVPRMLVLEEPATISRHFFGMGTPSSFAEWAKYNRMDDNIQFHHNMDHLFDPNVFADHPEYYPGGVIPTGSFQPCFNNATAAAAIQRIIAYFGANPQENSYSLGMNDNTNYCETPGHPDYPTKTNSVGNLHRSDLYYRWVNQIVEGVLQEYPDKYFGLLAYREMYDPPMNPDGTPYKLHPRVIPYITDDRMSWIDPDMGDIGKQHTENWLQSATSLGWYEYLYGSPYNVPRIYSHKMAEHYQYADSHSVVGHVAELYPNFGEGAKPWVSAKLQWNPNQNVDQLLQEWYVRAVGEEAAPYVQQYDELWEQFWTTRVFNSSWYLEWKNSPSRSNFLNLFEHSYLKEVTKADIAESRRLLELAVAHAGTEKQRARAGLLLRAFEFYEASALSYPRSGVVVPPANEQDALLMLEDLVQSYEMGQKRMQLVTDFAGHPTLYLPLKPPLHGGVWDGVQMSLISALQSYVGTIPQEQVVSTRLRQFLDQIPGFGSSAVAVKTNATKVQILQTLDFNTGPWTEAEPFSDFLVKNSWQEAPVQTKVRLLWDNENLYVGYENFDHALANMVASDDAPNDWWRSGADDSIETYVTHNPEGAYSGYYTNPKGVKFVYRKMPEGTPIPHTDSGWAANASIGSDRWSAIQVIPFSSIGVNPNEDRTLQAFFFRNYHGNSVSLGWGGGVTWNTESFHKLYLVETSNRVQNASFESGSNENTFSSWTKWVPDTTVQSVKRTDAIAHTGNYSLVSEAVTQGGGPIQDIAVTPGKYRATVYLYAPAGTTTSGTVQWWMNIKDQAGGRRLQAVKSEQRPVAWANGRWASFEYTFEIKTNYAGVAANHLQLCLTLWGFAPGEKVYMDDVKLYKLE